MIAETFAGTLPAIQRTDDHRYRSFEMEPGMYVPGCTTVVGMLNKDWLQRWYANCAAEAAIELYNARKMKGATRDQIAAAAGEKRDKAADAGTRVHAYAEKHVKGEAIAWIDPDVMDKVDAFRRWWDASGWHLRLSEAPTIKPPSVDVPYGWGGTLDILAFDQDGLTTLADIKTGSSIGQQAILQLAGLGMASRIAPGLDALRAYPMPNVQRNVILHVTNEGVRPIEVKIGAPERMAFLACLDLYYWTKTVKGRL